MIGINQGCNKKQSIIHGHDSFTELLDQESTDRGRQTLWPRNAGIPHIHVDDAHVVIYQ